MSLSHHGDLLNYLSNLKTMKNELDKSLFQYHFDKLPMNYENLKSKLQELCLNEQIPAKKNYYMHLLKIVLEHSKKINDIINNIDNIKNNLEMLHAELN